MNDIMIDLETLGTTADSVILSIGAVRFDSRGDTVDETGPNTFYCSVSVDSNTENGRRIDESTLAWWMGQSKEAQAVFREPKHHLRLAIRDLLEWVGPAGDNTSTWVWSNGADFDIPMVAHAARSFNLTLPWKFWNNRCMRTLASMPFADAVERPRPAVAHNALADAIAQARYVQLLMKAARE